MDRCALFVDASYALADGAMAVHGTRRRDSVSWNHAGLLTLLAGLAKDRTGLPVLRCYWYETAVEGARTPEQDALAEMPGLKLRLVNARPGRREGIETSLRRDLVTLAKNGAISDAFVASADEHLAEIVAEVQDLGLRVVILHISADGGWTIPAPLRQECDDIVEISGVHLRPFVELVRGAEPASADEFRGLEAIGSRRSGAPDALAGPLPIEGRALAAPSAQSALYSSLEARAPGDQVSVSAIHDGQHAHLGLGVPGLGVPDSGAPAAADHGVPGVQLFVGNGQVAAGQVGPILIGPGQVNPGQVGPAQNGSAQNGSARNGSAQAGSAQNGSVQNGSAQNGSAQAGSAQNGSAQNGSAQNGSAQMPGGHMQAGLGQIGPAQMAGDHGSVSAGSASAGHGQVGSAPLAPGYLNGSARQASAPQQTSGDGYLSGTHYGNSINGLADLSHGPAQNGVAQNGVAQNGASRTDYPGAAIHNGSYNGSSGHGGPVLNGLPPGRSENGAATSYHSAPPVSYTAGLGLPGVPAGGIQPAGAQPGDHQPAGLHGDNGRNGTSQYGASAAGPSQPPPHQNGAVSPGAPGAGPSQSGIYQLGPAQHGLSYQNGMVQAGPLQGLPQADSMRGSAQIGPTQVGPGQPGQVGPGQVGGLGQAGPGQAVPMYPAPVAPSFMPPGQAPMVGAVFGPPGQYGTQQPPGALPPPRAMQPTAVPLPEAVQAAHAEGFSFGESVGRDAPGLWLDAVLARKPRMPSDLEARLLQGSALPIDSLLHDEVRHSLRRGFWDALEGARR